VDRIEALAATTVVASLLAAPAIGSAAANIYVAGTRAIDVSSTVTSGEATRITGHGDATLIQYPRELAPLIGTVTMADSVDIGAAELDAVLVDGDTVYAVSQGAVVAHKIANRSDLTDVKLVTMGDPSAKGGLMTRVPLYIPGVYEPVVAQPDEWAQTNIVLEYDIIADTPDRLRPLALANAVLGGIYYHSDYNAEHLTGWDDPEKVTVTTDGEDTTVLFHSEKLPLVQPLRDLGVDERIVAEIEKPLKLAVDAAYERNDAKTKATIKAKVSEVKDKIKERRQERREKVTALKQKIRNHFHPPKESGTDPGQTPGG
jgi:hypothetical protein